MLNSIMCTSVMHSSSPVSDIKRGKNGYKFIYDHI